MTATATPIERRQFGELADDIAYLRRGCGLTVAPFADGFRIGMGSRTETVGEDGLKARAERERDLGMAAAVEREWRAARDESQSGGRGAVPNGRDNPPPHGESLQQGHATISTPSSLPKGGTDDARDAGNVAERETGPESAPRQSPPLDAFKEVDDAPSVENERKGRNGSVRFGGPSNQGPSAVADRIVTLDRERLGDRAYLRRALSECAAVCIAIIEHFPKGLRAGLAKTIGDRFAKAIEDGR